MNLPIANVFRRLGSIIMSNSDLSSLRIVIFQQVFCHNVLKSIVFLSSKADELAPLVFRR